jgi:hypothetical protein
MARIFLAAAAAFALGSGSGLADTLPVHLRIAHGQSIVDAMRQARMPAPRHPDAGGVKIVNPTITGGAVTSGTLTVGQANSIPVLQFSFLAKTYGFNFASFTFTSPNGAESVTYYYYPRTYVRSETVTFSPDSNVPYYAQPGQWQLTAVAIYDNEYNYTLYDQAQSATLFQNPYLTVVNNGPVDITPPVVTAGQVLTPTVSLSSPLPQFAATLSGTDDTSGMALGLVAIEPPGGSFSQADEYPAPFPLLSGTLTTYANIFSGQPTGTWSISVYALCDVAGNCFSDQNPADIQALFGTTSFTVTN